MRISISPTDPFPYLAEHLPPCKSRINISTHAVLERLPRADLSTHPHSLYNAYFPPLGVVDEPPRAPSMRTYSYLLDPTEVPTPPLNHPLPHYAGVALEPAHARAELAYHTHSVPMSTEVLPPQAHARPTHVLGEAVAKAQGAAAGAARGVDVDDRKGGGEGARVDVAAERVRCRGHGSVLSCAGRARVGCSVGAEAASLAYGLQPGPHGRARVPVLPPPERLDAYPNLRQQHKFVYHE